jgi:hypothetical protein
MPSRKRINAILEILRLSKNPYIFLGSYNNPDFDYFGDVDVDQAIEYTADMPQKIKNLLDRIKKFGPELNFGFVELKFGMDVRNYFRSERVEDYEKKWDMEFKDLQEARDYTKDKYTNRIFDVNASVQEIKTKLKRPNKIKLDVIVGDNPNFMIEIIYSFKNKPADLISEILSDVDKYKRKNRWDKVAKRLYSVAKIIEDESRKKKIVNILNPVLKELWMYYSLDIPQKYDWKEFVQSKKIDIDSIQRHLKQQLINKLII